MKTIFYIFFLMFAMNVAAQKNNSISTGIYYVFDKDDNNLNMFSLSYQRHLALGLNILIEYNKAQGGKRIYSFIKKDDIVELNYEHILGYKEVDFDKILGEHIHFQNYGIGLNKEVKLSDNILINFYLCGIYTDISRTRLSKIKRDELGNLLIDEFYSTYSNTHYWGLHSSFGINYKVKNYLKIGATIGYITKPAFFVTGINISVLF